MSRNPVVEVVGCTAKASESRRGFNLIELVVAINIVAVAIALALPAQDQAREAARRTQCKNNLKILGLAMHNYHDAHGLFNPGLIDDDHNATGAMHTGFMMLLPFIEESALYNMYNFRVGLAPRSQAAARNTDPPTPATANYFHMANSTTIRKQLNQFYCPSNRSEGTVELGSAESFAAATDYAMCNGAIPLLCGSSQELSYPVLLSGFFGPNSRTRVKDVRDGTSLTVAMGEVAGGEMVKGTANIATFQAPDRDALGFEGAGVRPWGIDQAWAVARISPGRAGGFPRGAILFAANQHIGDDLRIDGNSMTEMWAPMNPRFVMVSVAGTNADTPPSPTGVTGPCNNNQFGDRLSNVRSKHGGGAQFLMGDGVVRFVSENVDRRIYGYIMTIQGREIIDEDDF